MDLNEDDIYISTEKEINLSKEDNSLFIKSIEETEFNFIDLLNDKHFLTIFFNLKNINLQLSNKSIMKIFNFLTDIESGENLENNLTDYITFIILEDNLSYNKDATVNSIGILETPFKKLLDQTKMYKINIVTSNIDEIKKELLNFEQQNNKINISSKSIEKINKYLNKSIYDISDYIHIVILYDNENDFDKDILKKRLIDRYDKIGENIYFMGVKQFKTNSEVPLKNNKNPIYRINIIFNNVLNKIDSVENNSFDDSNSEDNKIFNNNLQKKNSNKNSEINIRYDINDDKTNYDRKQEYQITEESFEKRGGCKKEFCPNCLII